MEINYLKNISRPIINFRSTRVVLDDFEKKKPKILMRWSECLCCQNEEKKISLLADRLSK